MEEKKITPEERLLKIIENPNQQVSRKQTDTKTKGGVSQAKGANDILKSAPDIFRAINRKIFRTPGFRMVNKTLLVFSVLMTIFVFFDFFKFAGTMNKKFETVRSSTGTAEMSKNQGPVPVFDPASSLALSRKRNMFALLSLSANAASDIPEDIAQVIGSFKLVGIMWSANPQAMVENSKEQKTFLVNTGDFIGPVTVKKILRDRVILGKDDKEWDLR
jgi:type II secretory pathway component PulC